MHTFVGNNVVNLIVKYIGQNFHFSTDFFAEKNSYNKQNFSFSKIIHIKYRPIDNQKKGNTLYILPDFL